MTVQQLINQLVALNEPDTEVFFYNETGEEHGITEGVNLVRKQENVPYDKGDVPDLGAYNGRIVIIRGSCDFKF